MCLYAGKNEKSLGFEDPPNHVKLVTDCKDYSYYCYLVVTCD